MQYPNAKALILVSICVLLSSCGRSRDASISRLSSAQSELKHPSPKKLLTVSVPASVSVSELGYVGSVIALDTLPVGNQFSPKIALTYTSSMTEVGIAGLGWSLAGTNVISRCASQKIFDGTSKAIDWSSTDSWCMDGKKLLLVAGEAGQDGAEYRLFLDDMSRIVFKGGHFEVTRKSGEKLIFGETAESREEGLNEVFFSYHLKRILDRSGNAIDYYYVKDGGRLFLDQIRYGGNIDFNKPHYRTISFHYEKPPVSVARFVAGKKFEADRLLKSVTVGNGEKVSWTYRLHQERKTPASLPFLMAIDQCFKELECTSKTTFEYDYSEKITVSESPEFIWTEFGTQKSLTWSPDKSARAFTDINGDGYPDIIGIRKEEINFSLSGPQGPGPVVTQKRNDLSNWAPLQDMFAVADMNRDGFADIILFTDFSSGAGTYIAYWNGSGFDDFKFITAAFGKKWKVKFNIRSVIDVDGDGWQDVIGSGDDGIYVAFNDKNGGLTGGTEPLVPYFTGGGWLYKDSPRYFIDVNGDGFVDILGLGTKEVVVALGTGKSFKTPEVWSTHFITPTFPEKTDYRHIADMNGDGLPDIVGFGQYNVEVGLNTGKGFTPPMVWLNKLGYRKGWNKFRKERFVLDVNKDGFADIVGFREDGVEIYLNQGIPSPEQAGIKAPAFKYTRLNSWNSDIEALQLDDLDADGRTDMFLLIKEGVWKSQFEARPGKLIGVKTGFNEVTNIVYKSLMDPTVYSVTARSSVNKTILTGPLEVVASIKKSNGIGGFFETRYFYENGVYDKEAFGFLGFEKRHIFDSSAGTETIETYSHDVKKMIQGALVASEIYSNRTKRVLVSRSKTAIDAVSQSSHPYHRALVEKWSLANFFDEEGREIYSVAVEKEFDTYQNAELVVTTVRDAKATHTTRAKTIYVNDPEHWVIGLPERVTTTATSSVLPIEKITKTSTFGYDVSGVLMSETMEPDSAAWIKKEYSRNKNPYGLIDAVITSWGSSLAKGLNFKNATSSQEFDSQGFVTTTINALGHQKSQKLDAQTGLTVSTTDENGLVTSIEYDAANRPFLYKYPDGHRVEIDRFFCDSSCPPGAVLYQNQSSNRDGISTVYLDSLGRTIRTVQSLTEGEKVAVDRTYNEFGLLSRESKPYFLADGPLHWIQYQYDARNRQTLVVLPDGSRSEIIHTGLISTQIDAMDRRTIKEQDSRGLVLSIKNPKDEVLSYTYDASGQLLEMKDPGGNITKMEYDIYGRRIKLDDPSTGVTISEYNALGLLAEETRQGRRASYSYDALGRMLSSERNVPGLPVISESYIYDTAPHGVGQLAEAIGQDSAVAMIYDSLSRLSERTEKLLGRTYKKVFSYDGVGRIRNRTYPDGFTIIYDYDSVGQLNAIRDSQTNRALWKVDSFYANGDVKEYSLGNGARGIRRQDERTDRVIGESVSGPDQTLQMARSYEHYPVGNLKTRTDGITGKTESFNYDPLDRLETFTGSEFKTVTMRYDQLSRIEWRSDVGTYQYGKGCEGGFDSPFVPKRVGSKSYCSDARGNIVAAGERRINYDANSLPIEMQEENRSVRYNYGLGKSVLSKEEMIDGQKTLTRFAGDDFEVVEVGGSSKKRSYVGDFLIVETEGSALREHYLYKDYLGSTLVVADQNSGIVERMDYDPFGQRRNVNDLSWLEPGSFQPKATSRGFTGHDQIDSMNLVHMKGRVYDPTIALFLTPDPYIQDPTMVPNLNRYSYVVNNPLRYTDPTGHFFKKIAKEIGRGLSSAGKALSNPGHFLKNTWDKAGRAISNPGYQRLIGSVTISVVATVFCPYGAQAAWYQTAAYYGAVGATSSYVASNGDQKAALNGAFTGAAFNLVGSYFQYLSGGSEMSNSMIAGKIAAHGTVGGLSSVSQGGSFESGFLSAGLSQAAGQFGVYESLGASDNAQGWGIAYNAGVAAVVGGTISSATGGSFEDAALNAAMGRLFNDMSHVMKISPILGGMAAVDGPIPVGDIAAVGAGAAALIYGDEAVEWIQERFRILNSEGTGSEGSLSSPGINPEEIAGKTPNEIDAIAREKGLIPKGPDPAAGRGSYNDPVTGKQRVLVHPNGSNGAHCHVNDCSGQRLDINGRPVKPESPEAHLPLKK